MISFVYSQFAQSQSDELLIQGHTPKLYLEHGVVVKENWYSIGRLYNTNPKELAPYNGLTLAKPLPIGEIIKIPLTAVNFSQNGQKGAGETLLPVYHIIQEKEWMYRISINHNKVPIPNLEKWNRLNKDQVKAGMHLIVGFLKVKTALSALASHAGTTPVAFSGAPPPPYEPSTRLGAGSADSGHTVKETTAPVKQNPPPAKETAPMVKETPPTLQEIPPPGKNASSPQSRNGSTPTLISDEKTVAPEPSIHFNGGYFKTDFSGVGKSAAGLAGTFKSTSGWQDGKYYALMNNVPIGTIIKIIVPSSNKGIYAKILGQLPDMKESAGLALRISNAAAAELGEAEGKFNVEIKY
jgi:hypothetical protein